MKKLTLMIALMFGLITFSLNSNAQEKPKPFSHYSEETLNAIGATDNQRQAIKELAAKYRVKFRDLKAQESSISKTEYDKAFKKLNVERSKAYNAITTAEQKEILKELRAEHKRKQEQR